MFMLHPLYVGHFDPDVPSFRSKVSKPLDMDRVREILIKYCDEEPGGSPMIAAPNDPSAKVNDRWEWVGEIGSQSVLLSKEGYLQCIWLGGNEATVRFARELSDSLGAQIYDENGRPLSQE